MKKLLAILVTVAIVLSICVISATATEATVSISGDTSVAKNGTVKYTVSIAGCPEVSSASISITLGSNLSFVADSGTWKKGAVSPLNKFFNDTLKGVLGSPSSSDINGELFEFTVKGDTASATPQNIVVTVAARKSTEVVFDKAGSTTLTVNCGSAHDYGTLVSEVPAKCGVAGVKAHYVCSVCGKFFTSEKVETTETALAITALEHSPASTWTTDGTHHWKVCTRQGCGAVIESTKQLHNFEWKIDKQATEDEAGIKHEECSVCALKRNENTPISKLDHTHTGITYHAAVAATCKATGNVEYWTCSSPKCAGVYYGDKDCQTTLSTITVQKNADNHVGGTEVRDYKAPKCYEEGYTGDTYCLGCDVKVATGTTIGKTAHNEGSAYGSDADNHWKLCSVTECQAKLDSTVESHTFKWVVDKVPTTSEKGAKHEECTVCAYKKAPVEIPVLDHEHDVAKHEAKKSTCTVKGNIEYYSCSDEKCKGKYYSDENCIFEIENVELPLDANNHNYVDGKCTACGATDPNHKGDSPKTGENNTLIYVLIGCFVMLSAVESSFVYKKRKNR